MLIFPISMHFDFISHFTSKNVYFVQLPRIYRSPSPRHRLEYQIPIISCIGKLKWRLFKWIRRLFDKSCETSNLKNGKRIKCQLRQSFTGKYFCLQRISWKIFWKQSRLPPTLGQIAQLFMCARYQQKSAVAAKFNCVVNIAELFHQRTSYFTTNYFSST